MTEKISKKPKIGRGRESVDNRNSTQKLTAEAQKTVTILNVKISFRKKRLKPKEVYDTREVESHIVFEILLYELNI